MAEPSRAAGGVRMCGLELQKPADSEAASVLCDMRTAHSTEVTYHTAGELLQGGAAALLRVCWLLFQEGGRGGGRCG